MHVMRVSLGKEEKKRQTSGYNRENDGHGFGNVMGRVLIIGYGNPLRRDDGLGWLAAEHLEEVVQDDEVTILTRHQLSPELVEDIRKADLIIFIDACSYGTPGEVRQERIRPETGCPPDSFSHHLHPAALLACAKALYGVCPEAVVLSVAGESFDHGEGLSTSVTGAFRTIIEGVYGIIARFKESRKQSSGN